jgi:hypothetical protein
MYLSKISPNEHFNNFPQNLLPLITKQCFGTVIQKANDPLTVYQQNGRWDCI